MRPLASSIVWLTLGAMAPVLFTAAAAAEPRKFAAPLNVAAERSKIVNEFVDAQIKKLPYAEALATRDAAFGQLAAAAEQAKSTEYRELSIIYDALGRPQDLERTARAVLEQSPQDVGARLHLFKSLCDLKRVDEASRQYDAIVVLDVSADDQQKYLQRFPAATAAYVHLLIADKRLNDAKQAVAASAAQLDKLDVAWEKSPGFRKGVGGTTFSARQAIDSLTVELEKLRTNSLVKPSPAPVAGPTKPSPAPTAPPPFDVEKEIYLILDKFDPAKLPAAARTGPEAAKLLAQRDQALRALAARKEVATSKDYAGQIMLTTLLKRPDDGLIVYSRWLNEDLTSPGVNVEAWAIPLRTPGDKVTSFVLMLGEAGKFNEAFQALAVLNTKLDQLAALDKPGAAPPKLTVYQVNTLKSTILLHSHPKLRDAEGAAYAKATAPMPILYSRPFDITREQARINVRRNYLAKVDQARADAEAQAQRGLLAAAAEREPSPDYVEIASLYGGEDAFRVARGAVEKHPDKLAPRVALLAALSLYGPKEELVTEYLKLSDIDFSKISEYDAKQFLSYTGSAGHSAFLELKEQKKADEAKKLVDDWDTRLDVINARFPRLTGQMVRNQAPQGSVLFMRGTVASLRSQLPGGLRAPRGGAPNTPRSVESPNAVASKSKLPISRQAIELWKKWLGPFGTQAKPETKNKPEYQQAQAKYFEDLNKLAVEARAQKPVDHYGLFYIYVQLDRQEDSAREFHALLKTDPKNFNLFYDFITAQTEAKRYDEAAAIAREWLALDVPLEQAEAYFEPYGRTSRFIKIYEGLVEANRVDDARRLSGEVKAKIEKMLARYDAAPVAGVKRPTFTNAQMFARAADNDIDRMLEKRQLEQRQLEQSKEDVALLNAKGPLQFAQPLDLTKEYFRINRRANLQKEKLKPESPEYQAAEILLEADLARLATAAEAVKSTDHVLLLNIYTRLKRSDDVIRHARAELAANPQSPLSDELMTALVASQRLDEALALWRQISQTEVAPFGAGAHLGAWSGHTQRIINRLLAENKLDDAMDALNVWVRHYNSVVKGIGEAGFKREASGVNDAGEMIDLNKEFVFGAMQIPPIVADTWLNGSPLKPEDLRGKVVVLEYFMPDSPITVRSEQLNAWVKQYGPRGLVVIGVAKRPPGAKDDAKLVAYAKQYQLAYPFIVQDPSVQFGKDLKIRPMPATIFIDRRGVIRHKMVGLGDTLNEEREGMVRLLLDEKP